jgi:Flp pilus assembly protein TadG
MRLVGHSHGKRKRLGSAAVELIVVMPVLVIFLLGTIEFSMLLQARQQLLAAAREGARVGARGGSDPEIQAQVTNVLGYTANVNITRTAAAPPNTRDNIEVNVSTATTNLVPNLLPMIYNLNGQTLLGRAVMNVE